MSSWSRAAELADRTPPSRNRYIDFLRAISMLVVTVGHWLAAAPYYDATGTLTASHILTVAPWTAWLTWIVQVMPILIERGSLIANPKSNSRNERFVLHHVFSVAAQVGERTMGSPWKSQ